MPFRRRRPRRARRKPRRVNRRGGRRSMKVSTLRLRDPTGFPDQMYVKLRYIDTLVHDAVGFIDYRWQATNLIDVDLTGTGHQPMYFDNYTFLYNRWLVYAVGIKMEIVNVGGVPADVCMCPVTAFQTFSDVGAAQEQPHSKHVLVGSFGQNRSVLKNFMTTAKIRGETILDDNFSGQAQTSGPARPWFWQTVMQSSPDTTALNLHIKYTYTYYVRFFKRLVQNQS